MKYLATVYGTDEDGTPIHWWHATFEADTKEQAKAIEMTLDDVLQDFPQHFDTTGSSFYLEIVPLREKQTTELAESLLSISACFTAIDEEDEEE